MVVHGHSSEQLKTVLVCTECTINDERPANMKMDKESWFAADVEMCMQCTLTLP